jgi:hypothetical protein
LRGKEREGDGTGDERRKKRDIDRKLSKTE